MIKLGGVLRHRFATNLEYKITTATVGNISVTVPRYLLDTEISFNVEDEIDTFLTDVENIGSGGQVPVDFGENSAFSHITFPITENIDEPNHSPNGLFDGDYEIPTLGMVRPRDIQLTLPTTSDYDFKVTPSRFNSLLVNGVVTKHQLTKRKISPNIRQFITNDNLMLPGHNNFNNFFTGWLGLT
jgi:hypothetical protein